MTVLRIGNKSRRRWTFDCLVHTHIRRELKRMSRTISSLGIVLTITSLVVDSYDYDGSHAPVVIGACHDRTLIDSNHENLFPAFQARHTRFF